MLMNGKDSISLEEMGSFFDRRASTYEDHMLLDLHLDEFYEAVDACFVGENVVSLLDLGCGTGLELERLFRRFPELSVTAVDLSAELLKKLRQKFSSNQIRLIHGSYLDVSLGEEAFDHVLSTYSLHHFNEEEKAGLYAKTFDALVPGGSFVWGDYTAYSSERQNELMSEKDRLYAEQNISEGLYHFDTPLTVEAEIALLSNSGFDGIRVMRQWKKTSLLVAQKPSMSVAHREARQGLKTA